MPSIKNPPLKPGNTIKVTKDISVLVAIVGPIIQTPRGNYLPYIHDYYRYANGHVESWTYREGPVRKVEIVTETPSGDKTLWLGWR